MDKGYKRHVKIVKSIIVYKYSDKNAVRLFDTE